MIKSTLQALALLAMLAGAPPLLASTATQKEDKTLSKPSRVRPAPAGEAKAQVNINSATAQELVAALSGIGLKKAEAIVSFREQYGPFSRVEQLTEVPGIGKALVEANLTRMTL